MPAPVRLPAAVVSILLLAATASAATAPRGVVPADTWALPTPTELAVSSDGRLAVYGLATPERERDVYVYALHVLDLAAVDRGETPQPQPLRAAGEDPQTAVFSPDARFLAWVSSGEDGASELRIATVRGGRIARPKVVARIATGIAELAWSPDGEHLVFSSDDQPAGERDELDPWVITRSQIHYDGVGFLDDTRSHLFVISRQGRGLRQLTDGPWDDSEPAWSPDGRFVAFVSNRHPDPDVTDDSDLYLVPAAGGEPRRLPTGPGPDLAPRWSHRGDRLAYLSARRANDVYQPLRVATIRIADEVVTDLSGPLDAWAAADSYTWGTGPAAPRWSTDDATILIPLEDRGANRVVVLDSREPAAGPGGLVVPGTPPPSPPGTATPGELLGGGAAVHDLVRQRTAAAAGQGEAGALVFVRSDPTHPPELFVAAADGSRARRISHLHDAWLATRTLVEPERIVARNDVGDAIDAWLYPPRDRVEGRRYPLVLYIHGGPTGYDGAFFDLGLENQLLPAAGWAVLRVNYRGSTGYGEAFSRAIWGDWHSREHADLMAAVDEALRSRPWIDPERLGIGGWSYGGIMTIWAVGHTDRFAVGVPERFAVDYPSSFGEDQWFTWYLAELGDPIENVERYRALSPGATIDRIRTPLYLIANELDLNCPLPQALQLYQRLKLLGQSTELVVYPGEPHSMQVPSHLEDRLERLLGWFGRHLDGGGPVIAAP